MLPKSHQKELLSWLDLLQNLEILFCQDKNNSIMVKQKWQKIQDFLQTMIMTLDSSDLDITQQSLFLSWQTETYRYIRLLQTDFLFYQSAKQLTTKENRYLIIQQKLKNAINLTKNYLLATNNQ
ncbi:heterocyst frequency control protein PatD [Geminocystis sp. GBBB08]|uniref:heterocyst frequency control protein PatD n=1 Tax=Geminocystis sp. GBBB08 TaxID=2604140 RepID=UPI0027E3726D|nr:heterocyst frequency control protein PatD [Geminocystis sp. GBBB08]MBL1211171.1 hypothetical protein [Geminocystis sp. GBBB08]